MIIFFYQTRKKAPFNDILALGNYNKIILSNVDNTKVYPLVTLLDGIATAGGIQPNDNYLYLIPLGLKNELLSLLNDKYLNTVWIEYQTTTKPANILPVGDDQLHRFYKTIKTPATVLQIMSPPHKDIFLAGTRLYELITKRVPYQPLVKPSKYNPNISNQLDEVVLKALKTDHPTECFGTVKEFGEALACALKESAKPVKKKLPCLKLGFVGLVLVLILLGSIIFGMKYFSCPPPPELLCETKVTTPNPKLADYAALLVSCLEAKIPAEQHIYINPLTLFVSGEPKQHVDVFDSVLREALINSTRFKPLNPKQLDSTSIDLNSLRQQARRNISKSRMSLIADLLKADSELKGNVRINEEQINLEIMVINNQDEIIAYASIEFPKSLSEQDVISQVLQAKPVNPSSQLEIATSRGVYNVTYLANEKIRLFIRTNQSAYIYVFVVEENRHVTYLYPQKLHTNGILIQLPKVEADELFIIPDDGLPFDIAAQPPFGKSTFWVVASTNLLEFPADKDDSWYQMNTLRPKLHKLGQANSENYAEAELVVNTIGPSNNGN